VVLKPLFNGTGNCFVETGYLPVMASCATRLQSSKEGSRGSETQLRNHYIDSLHEVSRHVQCNQTLWLPPGAVAYAKFL